MDVGGGASKLIDLLVAKGYEKVTVFDISSTALERTKERLGGQAGNVRFIEGDITRHEFDDTFDLWHDRAVFHFLTDPVDRGKYVSSVKKSLRKNGHIIIASFSLEGPPKCSGLDVVRYNPEALQSELGDGFELVETFDETHVTPLGGCQKFVYCHFIKRI